MSSAQTYTRNNRIDVIRGVSIILVLVHHFNIPYKLTDTLLSWSIFGQDIVQSIARNGNYGVTMFFVISGYLITTHTDRRWNGLSNIQPRAFYTFRIARIIPCLLLLLLVVNILAFSGLKPFQNNIVDGEPYSFWIVNFASLTFWMNVLIINVGWVNYALGVLWSLSVEEVFYLTFPILCLVLKREKYLMVFWLMVILFAPFYRFMHHGEESGAYLYAYFSSFDGIAIGCCTALIAKKLSFTGKKKTVIQLLTVAIMVGLYFVDSIKNSNPFGVTIMALGTAILIITSKSVGTAKSQDIPNPLSRVISWLGKHSYELYLFHLIVLGTCKVFWFPKETFGNEKLFILALYLFFSILFATLIARYFANPANSFLRNWLLKKT